MAYETTAILPTLDLSEFVDQGRTQDRLEVVRLLMKILPEVTKCKS